MGGVISTLIAALFILNAYNSFAYEVSITNLIFKKQTPAYSKKDLGNRNKSTSEVNEENGKNSEFSTKSSLSANLFVYLKYNVYCVIKEKIKRSLRWDNM